jgi:transcriptional regulator with XRE-family HTH domain
MSGPISGPHSGDLARRIIHRREELGLSLEEVAQRSGMDAGYLAYVEQSSDAALHNGTLLRLAEALEIAPAALAGGDVDRPAGSGRAGPHPALETLNREQCETHLSSGGVGRVVYEAERGPVAHPVNFRFVDGNIVFRTEPGSATAISTGAVVGFEVDHIDDAMSEGWSVLVTGPAEVVTDSIALRRFWAIDIEPWAGGDREMFVRIQTRDISGRAIRQEPSETPGG